MARIPATAEWKKMDLAWDFKPPKGIPKFIWRLRYIRPWTSHGTGKVRNIDLTEYFFTEKDANEKRDFVKNDNCKVVSLTKYETAPKVRKER